MAYKQSPFSFFDKSTVSADGGDKRKKKKEFKKKVKDLKKANKVQAGQDLKQVGPSSYQNVNNNVVYSDPKGVVRKTKDGHVMDDDIKQRKGKFVKNKSKPRGTRRNSK
tara:strand:- start:1118 stop:1444 length:327 start_codon:yes stop_codon:yes gene_type:complete